MPAAIPIGGIIAGAATGAAVGASWIVPMAIAGGVAAGVGANYQQKQAEKAAAKQEAIQRGYLTLEEKAILEQKEIQETQAAINKDLEEKRLTLEAQRGQIETLANLISAKQTLAPAQTPVVVTAPSANVQSVNIVDRFNQFVSDLFRG